MRLDKALSTTVCALLIAGPSCAPDRTKYEAYCTCGHGPDNRSWRSVETWDRQRAAREAERHNQDGAHCATVEKVDPTRLRP